MSEIKEEVRRQIAKRRTFAIISHPDAGKTTLTEKFLLYGGAINQAGSVKGKAQPDMRCLTGWRLKRNEAFPSPHRFCSLITADTVSISWIPPAIRTFRRIRTVP